MSDNTASSTPTPCKYHRFYESACRQCVIANNDGGPFLPSPIPAQCELVDKAALDALREAVKGCDRLLNNENFCGIMPTYLCYDCKDKRDAALSRLLGSEIEGDSND